MEALADLPVVQPTDNSFQESESQGSIEDVPIAETTDDLIVNDCGESKSIRKVDHTFLLG
jgi:hypothetical protein